MPLMAWVKAPPRPIQKLFCVQLLGDPLRLERIFATVQRLQHREGGIDEAMVGEDAAIGR